MTRPALVLEHRADSLCSETLLRPNDVPSVEPLSALDALEDSPRGVEGPSASVPVVPLGGSERQRDQSFGPATAANWQSPGMVSLSQERRLFASAPSGRKRERMLTR
jgi:hypothetical protein